MEDCCEIYNDPSLDCNHNGVLDECEPCHGDCNNNGVDDCCDIYSNPGLDCQPDGILDSCQTQMGCPCSGWEEQFPAGDLDGEVLAMTVWDPDGAGPNDPVLVVGGSFTHAGGVEVNQIAQWDGKHWQPLASGISGPYRTVHALTVYNNDLIAGGDFTTAGGVDCSNIARWDGAAWHALGSGTTSSVLALTTYTLTGNDTELIVGGEFTDAGGDPDADYIARWNGNSWHALGLGMDRSVTALTVYNDDLIAGGNFTTAGGVNCNYIARWNGTAWQALGSGIDSYFAEVDALTVDNGTGTLVVGGAFATAGGVPNCNNIARWNGTSNTWQAVGSGTDGPVYALTVHSNKLIAGGDFTAAGGVPCNAVACWYSGSWQPLGEGMGNFYYYPRVRALAAYGGQSIAGGYFTSAGSADCFNIARWDANNSIWRAFGSGMGSPPDVDPGFDLGVGALTAYNGELIAGGGFRTAGGDPNADYIARWNESVWQRLGSGVDGMVRALTVYSNKLIAGGDFTTAGGVQRNYIAAWDGTAGTWQSLSSGMDGPVYALTVYGGTLVAGGSFSNAGGSPCYNIATWNGSTWQALGSGMNGYVRALVVYNGDLIAGGDFTAAGGQPCNYIARWNGTAWQALGSGMSDYVHALAIYEGDLIAGGDFLTAGAEFCYFIARWDNSTSTWQPLKAGIDVPVRALAAYGNTLFAGGTSWSPFFWAPSPGHNRSLGRRRLADTGVRARIGRDRTLLPSGERPRGLPRDRRHPTPPGAAGRRPVPHRGRPFVRADGPLEPPDASAADRYAGPGSDRVALRDCRLPSHRQPRQLWTVLVPMVSRRHGCERWLDRPRQHDLRGNDGYADD